MITVLSILYCTAVCCVLRGTIRLTFSIHLSTTTDTHVENDLSIKFQSSSNRYVLTLIPSFVTPRFHKASFCLPSSLFSKQLSCIPTNVAILLAWQFSTVEIVFGTHWHSIYCTYLIYLRIILWPPIFSSKIQQLLLKPRCPVVHFMQHAIIIFFLTQMKKKVANRKIRIDMYQNSWHELRCHTVPKPFLVPAIGVFVYSNWMSGCMNWIYIFVSGYLLKILIGMCWHKSYLCQLGRDLFYLGNNEMFETQSV